MRCHLRPPPGCAVKASAAATSPRWRRLIPFGKWAPPAATLPAHQLAALFFPRVASPDRGDAGRATGIPLYGASDTRVVYRQLLGTVERETDRAGDRQQPAGAPGGSIREAWRQALALSVAPVAELVTGHLREALDVLDLTLDMRRARAADVVMLARAWRSMVGQETKMDPDQARDIVGL